MRKLLVLICLFVIFVFQSTAQTVVNSTGASLKDGAYQIDYSIGEISITTLSSTSNFITQGVLQPQVKFLDPQCEIISGPLQTFPNPTRDKFRMVGQYDWITGYHIYATDGKLVRIASFFNNYDDSGGTVISTGNYQIKLPAGYPSIYSGDTYGGTSTYMVVSEYRLLCNIN